MTDPIPVAEREDRPADADQQPIALFQADEGRGFHARWDAIQTGFVDEPRAAVEQAHALVDEMTNRLTEVFTRERARLEEQWSRGQDASTEDLRLALKRYRSFFERLLSI
jgi:hypothetical protein